jgi:hypothetical protein
MHPAMLGFLIGLGIALFFVISEYTLLNKEANETANRLKRKPVWTDPMKKRMRGVLTFSIVVVPAVSLGCWIVLPKLGL